MCGWSKRRPRRNPPIKSSGCMRPTSRAASCRFHRRWPRRSSARRSATPCRCRHLAAIVRTRSSASSSSDVLRLSDVEAAAERIAGRVLRTPAMPSDAVARAAGAEGGVKLDNLQVVGAFKERGAANRLALLSDRERERGVIAMSAGNHAQAVARHARLSNVGATIVMPKFTPATKVTRTASWGAKVVLHGETLAEAAMHAEALAA